MSNNDIIKELRNATGAGIMDIKDALSEAGDDTNKAMEILRKKGVAKMTKKSDRLAEEGIIESYIHAGGRIGVLVEINCETDFVARTDDFKELASGIALHIAASNPLYVNSTEVPPEVVEKEKEIYKDQAQDKPADVVEKMLEGKINKYFEEVCLMNQKFVKNPDITIEQYIGEATAKIGEKITVSRFSRFVLGN